MLCNLLFSERDLHLARVLPFPTTSCRGHAVRVMACRRNLWPRFPRLPTFSLRRSCSSEAANAAGTRTAEYRIELHAMPAAAAAERGKPTETRQLCQSQFGHGAHWSGLARKISAVIGRGIDIGQRADKSDPVVAKLFERIGERVLQHVDQRAYWNGAAGRRGPRAISQKPPSAAGPKTASVAPSLRNASRT